MSHAKNVLWTFIFFFCFIALLIVSVVYLTTPPTIPTCNGHAMSQGDQCEVFSNGTSQGAYNYDQQFQRNINENHHNIAITAGLSAACLIGGLLTLSEVRKKR